MQGQVVRTAAFSAGRVPLLAVSPPLLPSPPYRAPAHRTHTLNGLGARDDGLLGKAKSPWGIANGAIAGNLVATCISILGGAFLANYISEKLAGYLGGVLFPVLAVATFFGILSLGFVKRTSYGWGAIGSIARRKWLT